jgi:hypothetical protein
MDTLQQPQHDPEFEAHRRTSLTARLGSALTFIASRLAGTAETGPLGRSTPPMEVYADQTRGLPLAGEQ